MPESRRDESRRMGRLQSPSSSAALSPAKVGMLAFLRRKRRFSAR